MLSGLNGRRRGIEGQGFVTFVYNPHYMDQDQKDYFRLAADNVGFDAVLEEDPEHWHLTKR